MTQSFTEFLAEQQADAAVTQEAAILYLGEATDDLSPDEMQSKVAENCGDSALVQEALEQLRRDPALTENVLLAMLARSWDEPAEQVRIRRAYAAARTKLPVIETIVVGSVALYGLYVLAYLGYLAVADDAVPPATPASAVGSLYEQLLKHAPP